MLVTVCLGLVVAAQASSGRVPTAGPTAAGATTAGTDEPTQSQQPRIVRGEAGDLRAIGNLDAPVTMVQWTDVRCPYCALFSRETMPQIIKEYIDAGKLRIEVNDVAFFGEESLRASIALRAAGRQGLYFEYLQVVHQAAPEKGKPDPPRAELIEFAERVGVPDLEQFTADLDDPALERDVIEDTQSAQQTGRNADLLGL